MRSAFALPLLLFPLAAAASCGSAFCTINTDWDTQAPWQDDATRLDLRAEYIRQDQLRAGTDKAAAAAESSAANATPALLGTTWRLTELGGKPAPLGQDGKAATLELIAEGNRASGFSGCNRMTGPYELHGDSLRLGPLALTRMACMKGMDLEKQYVETLQRTRAYRQSAAKLELLDSSGILARLEAQ